MHEAALATDSHSVRIIFVDEQTMVRIGLCNMLMENGDFAINQTGSVTEAVALLDREEFDVLVLAGSMSLEQRLDSVSQINAIAPALPILIIDDGVDEVFAREIMKRGATGYISNRSKPDELLEAVQRLSAGRSYMSTDAARMLAASALSNEVDPVSTLSPRELQVFEGLASGRAVGDIARDLKLTSKTVSNHRLAVLKKMGVKTTVELAHLLHRRGMRSRKLQ